MWRGSRLSLQEIYIFLLTHPVWDVTMAFMCSSSTRNISTHTSRVGCDLFSVSLSALSAISTHTSRVGCDADLIARPALVCISTHTSRVGCDGRKQDKHLQLANFYSHIPCGMWLNPIWALPKPRRFLLTHPVWDVTSYIVRSGGRK